MTDRSFKSFILSFNKAATWLALGLFIVTGYLALVAMPNPLPGWANVTGLHLTAWGLLVTVGGFTITLFQLRETKSSFQAAREAV